MVVVLYGKPICEAFADRVCIVVCMESLETQKKGDWMEWVLGLERMTKEQAARAALFRKQDAALIEARSKTPYLDKLGQAGQHLFQVVGKNRKYFLWLRSCRTL